ncbi:hypothetical protein C5471_14860 [Photorhabdus tasmaniensis]|uniref:Uncharacterized protein n=1 Tax=Photorhabdus tasmaniensis TaxID=1004159 RepID=A0ABX0GKZ4_9GAMM|nr:hypothetical protein [Photorhabdus tasmaniensis]
MPGNEGYAFIAGHYLLVRHSLDDKQERAYLCVYALREEVSLNTLVVVVYYRFNQSGLTLWDLQWLAQSRLFPRNQPFPDMLHSPPSFKVQTHYWVRISQACNRRSNSL